MRRLIDMVLIAGILVAVGFGAYELGTRVDSTSNNLAKHDSELNQKVYRPSNPKGPSRHTIELVGIAVGGALGVMILVSFSGALLRTRRRQHWRHT
ncbi:MAG TPA: hypothetical protein VFI04_08400 [Gaiellaceae bacterium]|jgi:hypothetical protein|nr:hypothetical protein [Gaiellaceae bacterium]